MADRVTGRVILVGGGPGADDLITVRGLDRLMAADVWSGVRAARAAAREEMHRHRARRLSGIKPASPDGATSHGRVERLILTAYRLLSGYGLRAWRAIAALAVSTALSQWRFTRSVLKAQVTTLPGRDLERR